jgi:hypothetical protein
MSSSKPMATPVLLIRGLGGTSNVWFAQRAVLARSFRVICPSDTPQDICQHLAAHHCDKVKSLALLGLLVEPPRARPQGAARSGRGGT